MRLFRSLLLVLAALSASAQTRQPIDFHNFGLRPQSQGTAAVYLGATKAQVLRVLGQPRRVSRYFFETENGWATVLHYGPNQLYVFQNHLVSAEVHDGRWVVGRPGSFNFRVGTALAPGAAHFGSYAVEAKPGRSHNYPYQATSHGGLRGQQVVFDESGYEILFDQRGRVAHVFID